jgi:hypothetical protein
MLPLDSDRWNFCRETGCRDEDRVWLVQDRLRIQLWLSRFKRDAAVMSAMRALLTSERRPWPLDRMTDEDVIDQIAGLLLLCRLHLHVQMATQVAVGIAPKGSAKSGGDDTFAAPLRAPVPTRTQPTEAEAPIFSSGVDPVAQAAVLTAAAQSGQPFCPQ